ncbi:hypothetical protein NKR23_g9016 [Pleurostoma richardsiae]|uniref:Uncharacterized protein n=1 Tax=Pleurostoma richardsiae TaxID=41990 RepID=A0AA38RPB4_9PEZI|nr:hypothetical protein NKR23_g9016 [Pleurostoma richardsiae]
MHESPDVKESPDMKESSGVKESPGYRAMVWLIRNRERVIVLEETAPTVELAIEGLFLKSVAAINDYVSLNGFAVPNKKEEEEEEWEDYMDNGCRGVPGGTSPVRSLAFTRGQ